MQIQLTITLKGVQGTATAITIAEQAAEHLMETFNDDGSLKKVAYTVLKPGANPLKDRILAELSAWCEECEDIADAVTTTEEVVSYTERMNRVKALIKEVKKS